MFIFIFILRHHEDNYIKVGGYTKNDGLLHIKYNIIIYFNT